MIEVARCNDAAELEADRAAGRVLSDPHAVRGVSPPTRSPALTTERSRPLVAPPLVHRVLSRSGRPLEADSRRYFEPRYGHDFGAVRIHDDAEAARSAKAVTARAYTVGNHVVLGGGDGPERSPSRQYLLAHELAHVIQQSSGGSGDRVALRRYPDGDTAVAPSDAGVPPVAGVPEMEVISQLPDEDLFQEYAGADGSGESARAEALDEEMAKRAEGWGTALPRGPQPVVGGGGAITPEVGLKLLDNMSRGEPPFKPSEGRGGSSWFTTEGEPYTAVTANKSINVQVEIATGSKPLLFGEAELVKLSEAELASATKAAEAQYRAKFKVPEGVPLSNRATKAVRWNAARIAESRMWTRVGEMVAASAQRTGEVVLEPGSRFSAKPGKFAVVADASKITLKGGTGPLVDALVKQGAAADAPVVQAAEKLATKMKWAGRVRTAFRYGGRVLIVVAVAADAYEIHRAQDKLKAVVTSVGGWAGALAAGGAFAAWFAPADVAGPWAWAAHGVGTLVAGGVGYWVGSETTRYIYELVAE